MGHKTRDKKLDFVDRLLKHQLEFYEEFRRQQRNYREEQLRAIRRQWQECKLDSYLALPNLPSIIELPAFEEQEEQLSRLLVEQMDTALQTSRDNPNNSEHRQTDINLTTYHQWISYRTCREQQQQRLQQTTTTFYVPKRQFCNEFDDDDDDSNEDENECVNEQVEDNDEEAVRRWFANFSANHQTAYMPLPVCPNV